MDRDMVNNSDHHICLKICGLDYPTVNLKILKDFPLGNLFEVFCESYVHQKKSVRFIYNDHVIHNEDTPISLGMKENDIIEIFPEKTDISTECIKVKVLALNNPTFIIAFNIQKTVSLKNLKIFYCEYVNLQESSIAFIFNGQEIRDEDTPISLGMEENDIIEILDKIIRNPTELMKVNILGLNNPELVTYNIKKTVPFKNLKSVYCEDVNIQENSIAFIFNGREIHDEDTAISIGLTNDNTIQIMKTQIDYEMKL